MGKIAKIQVVRYAEMFCISWNKYVSLNNTIKKKVHLLAHLLQTSYIIRPPGPQSFSVQGQETFTSILGHFIPVIYSWEREMYSREWTAEHGGMSGEVERCVRYGGELEIKKWDWG